MSNTTRTVAAKILTTRGWLAGTFVIPRLQQLHEFLNHSAVFTRFTDVHIDGTAPRRVDLAIRNTSIALVLPNEEPPAEYTVPTQSHDVLILFEEGELRARIEVLEHANAFEFIVHQNGFITVHSPVFHPRNELDSPIARGLTTPQTLTSKNVAFVNCQAIIGIVVMDLTASAQTAQHEMAGAR
jgi:hypothetical protein